MVKTAENAPATAEVCSEIIAKCFPEEFVKCFNGGKALGEELLQEQYDFMFYTGGINGGKAVMASAAKSLTPLVLELGGKSPCIIEASADLKLAATRLAFGKWLNCGQTCVAPDYVLIDRRVKNAFLEHLKGAIPKMYGQKPL